MELRQYRRIFNFNQDTVVEWSVRRVQRLLVTVKFEPYTSPIIGASCDRSRPRKCLYCSCLCEKLTTRRIAYKSQPLKCDHCQYYPESHSDRCIGRLKERSGSLAYILRHLTVKEKQLLSKGGEMALDSHLCLFPLRFPLIEKVRQRFQAHPLGNDPRFETFIRSRGFITSTGLNGYEGYQLMLTNTSSTVDPIIRDEWLKWHHNQARLLASPREYIGTKVPLPSRLPCHGARCLQYVVVETDLLTGSRFFTASPWIHVGNDDKYMRLEVTSLPLGGHLLCSEERRLGDSRTFQGVTRENVHSAIMPLKEDEAAGGYPIATLESAPLKHFDRDQDRGLYYVIREKERREVSETIPLDMDAKYLKIVLTTS